MLALALVVGEVANMQVNKVKDEVTRKLGGCADVDTSKGCWGSDGQDLLGSSLPSLRIFLALRVYSEFPQLLISKF